VPKGCRADAEQMGRVASRPARRGRWLYQGGMAEYTQVPVGVVVGAGVRHETVFFFFLAAGGPSDRPVALESTE